MADNGFNPMRWDCEKRGCFNVKRRPKIEVFAGCFPGKISFGDIDGIVEINGFALLLEWKSDCNSLPIGQRIMYSRITKDGKISVIIVNGNAETMEIQSVAFYFKGKWIEHRQCDLDGLKEHVKKWSEKACKGEL